MTPITLGGNNRNNVPTDPLKKIAVSTRTVPRIMALDVPELSPRELATRFTDAEDYFVSESSCHRRAVPDIRLRA